jgi:hypothetical protein
MKELQQLRTWLLSNWKTISKKDKREMKRQLEYRILAGLGPKKTKAAKQVLQLLHGF